MKDRAYVICSHVVYITLSEGCFLVSRINFITIFRTYITDFAVSFTTSGGT